MTPKQRQFVREYLIDLNATQAAIRAGYSKRTAQEQGSRLLSNVMVSGAIEEAMGRRADRTDITADRVLEELALIGFADMGTYVKLDGGHAIFDWSDLPPDATKVISEITQETYVDGKGEDAETVKKTKFKLHDKRAALVDMGRHLGMFTDNINVGGEVHWMISDETMDEDAWSEAHGDSVATPAGASESTH